MPPLIRVNLEKKLFPDLLVQDELAIGRLYVSVVEGTVGSLHVAVESWAILAALGVVNKVEVYTILDLRVEIPEIFDEAV